MIKELISLLRAIRSNLNVIANTSTDKASRNLAREAQDWIDGFLLKFNFKD